MHDDFDIEDEREEAPPIRNEEEGKELQGAIQLRRQYAEMMEMPAWQDLNGYMEREWETANGTLQNATEMKDVVRAQERLKALKLMWERIESVNAAAEAAHGRKA